MPSSDLLVRATLDYGFNGVLPFDPSEEDYHNGELNMRLASEYLEKDIISISRDGEYCLGSQAVITNPDDFWKSIHSNLKIAKMVYSLLTSGGTRIRPGGFLCDAPYDLHVVLCGIGKVLWIPREILDENENDYEEYGDHNIHVIARVQCTCQYVNTTLMAYDTTLDELSVVTE